MSRALFTAAVWAVLFAVMALLVHLAGPEPRVASPQASAEPAAFAVVPEVPPPQPIAEPPARVEPAAVTTVAPTTATLPPPAQVPMHPTQPTPRPKRFPQKDKEGATESGIPGLGSLPPGPGAAYQGLGVQVYSAGQPVVGANVRFALQDDIDAWQHAHPDTPIELADPEDVLQLCEKPVQTRQYGVALAESMPGRMLVDAKIGKKYGFVWVDRDKEARARIDLVDDCMLTAQVRDVFGAPRENAAVIVRDSSCAELWRGVTNEAGIAVWRHATFLMERDASPGNCIAALEDVTTFPIVREIRRPFGEIGLIELTAQSTEALRLDVVDESGHTVSEPLRVTCAIPSAGCGSRTQRTLRAGSATFERVEFAPDLEVTIDGGSVFESVTRKVTGSAFTGGTKALTLTCGRRYPVVRARLVGPDGKPLANVVATAWHEYRVFGPTRSLEALTRPHTDDAGAVRLTMPYVPENAREREVLVVAQNEYGDWCHAERTALGAPLAAGELDLGELHMTEMPTIAAGYVLADKGWPVPNAIVEVSSSDDPNADPESFRRDARFDAVADQMGRFRLRGLVSGAHVALTASSPNHVRPPRRIVERGERKVQIDLARCASISGKLLLATGISMHRTHVWIDLPEESIPAVIDTTLNWRCTSLPPGKVGLHVTVDGLPESAYEVPSITLAPGTEFNDIQTTTIDLRDHVTRFVLVVRDAQGTALASGTATVTEPREEGPFRRTIPIEKGVLEVIALRPAVDVEIRQPGFEPLVMRGVTRGGDVKLVPLREN